MKLEIIKQQDCATTNWSGGTTTQLFISPAGASVTDDFIFRISSATVENGSSVFSNFTGYNRFLTILQGKMLISHNSGKKKYIGEFEPVFFDGADITASSVTERIVDFNIIWKKDIKDNVKVGIVHDNECLNLNGTIFIYNFLDNTRVYINSTEYLLTSKQLLTTTADNLEVQIEGKCIYCTLYTQK